ncbi:Protein kinase superfamily protein [Prunus dulcis]|uniref:Protein kinase superfamily protein n=1 Tax=Prunus dulcis TaxID=3755 RepID=A0A4Y1QN50_PRUDU|nr:Protein kinase superfamily protein [Prunus dulcis]
MPGIAPEVISHKLSISPAYKPVRQKRRSYDAERYEAMRTEVDKLQTIGFIREATYPVWLANSVMVRKATGGGECAKTIPISTRPARRTAFRCHG